jgi:hypothetical protein
MRLAVWLRWLMWFLTPTLLRPLESSLVRLGEGFDLAEATKKATQRFQSPTRSARFKAKLFECSAARSNISCSRHTTISNTPCSVQLANISSGARGGGFYPSLGRVKFLPKSHTTVWDCRRSIVSSIAQY